LTIAAAPAQSATADQVENDGGQVAPSPARPRSICQLSPWADGAVIGGASIAIALPYAFTVKLITPRCPCDPAEVNAFDRGAIGNHSARARMDR